jgi:hypothetical protein
MTACSISSGKYMSILWRLFLRHRWWWLALPVMVCLALVAVDTRFAYVALIVAMASLMIALPMVYYYGLTQESRWSILEKNVSVVDEGLQLDFTDERMHRQVIVWSEMDSTTALNECLIIKFKKNRYTFLAIPLNTFSTKDELRKFVLEIRRRIAN